MSTSATQAIVRLDLLTVRPYRKQLLGLIPVGLAVTLATPDPSVALPCAAVYAALYAAYPFAIGDKADLMTLLGALPIERSAVVAGRYVFAVLAFLGATAIATLAMFAVAAARAITLDPATTAVLLATSFTIFAITVGIQFPMYFAMGYTRARLLAYLPFAGIALVVAAGAQLLPESAGDLTPGAGLTAGISATGLSLLAISASISRTIFNRRNL